MAMFKISMSGDRMGNGSEIVSHGRLLAGLNCNKRDSNASTYSRRFTQVQQMYHERTVISHTSQNMRDPSA